MKIKNLALTISLISFAIGFSDLGDSIIWQLGRPFGAVAFIVFFIFVLLEKEYRILDEQESYKARQLDARVTPAKAARESGPANGVTAH